MADSKISALTSYTTPLDADVLPIVDTANTATKKVSWSNTKATLKTYFDTLYQTVGTYLTASSTATLTNKTFDTAGTGNSFSINSVAATANTGTGSVVRATSPSITTPTITKPVMSATNPTAQTYTPSAAGTATLDLSLSNQHDITMPAGNITIALSNDTNNQVFMVSITQDSTGSRTVTWFTTIKWAGGVAPTLTTTANKRDVFGFKRTGSGTYDGDIVGLNH